VLAKSALPNRLRLAACPQAQERVHAQYMPNLDQRRWIVVTIVVSFLAGCTESDDTPWAAQTPEAQEQVPSGLIAFVSDRDGSDALFVMRSDGSGVRCLTVDLPAVFHPSWSADGQRMAFNAGSPTASDIYLINVDGSGLRKITSSSRANFYPPGLRTARAWRSALIGTVTGTSMS
jgi:WD40-like Beta Propeller Repeat